MTRGYDISGAALAYRRGKARQGTAEERGHAMAKVSAEIQSVEVEGEFRVCPECDYGLGFHVSFFPAGGEGMHMVLICPSCGARYDLGQKL